MHPSGAIYSKETIDTLLMSRYLNQIDPNTVSYTHLKSRIVGTLSPKALCYVISDSDQKWVYIESGDEMCIRDRNLIVQCEEISLIVILNFKNRSQKPFNKIRFWQILI